VPTLAAGAWNALAVAGGRHGAGALRQEDVVAHLKQVLEEQIAAKRARFERLLGADIKDFEAALDDAIAADPSGKSLGGKSKAEPGLKRRELTRLVVQVAKERGGPELVEEASHNRGGIEGGVEGAAAATSVGVGDGGAGGVGRGGGGEAAAGGGVPGGAGAPPPPPLTCFGAIAALIRDDEAAGIDVEEAGTAGDAGEDDDGGANEPNVENNSSKKDGACYDDTLADALAAGIDMSCGVKKKKKKKVLGGGVRKFGGKPFGGAAPFGGGAAAAAASVQGGGDAASSSVLSSSTAPAQEQQRWDWRRDLHELLKKRGGLEKLNRPKPSTGEFGNWGVIEACQRQGWHFSRYFAVNKPDDDSQYGLVPGLFRSTSLEYVLVN
jgi:hypothetical protein